MTRAAAALVILLTAAPAAAQTLVHGDGDPARYDIVFLGDGFTADQQATYAKKVADAVARLLTTDVYKDMKDAFNVWRVDTVSNESGIDDPAKGITRDTAFDLSYGKRVHRCIGPASSAGRAAIFKEAGKAPGRDKILVLANTTGWGGCAFGAFTTSSVARNYHRIVAHELGHGIGSLADEYEYGRSGTYAGGEPSRVNCTKTLSPLKWQRFATPGVAIPTPETTAFRGKVGAFEGCSQYRTGIYRPALGCKMRSSSAAFCPVCAARMREVLGRFRAGSRDLAVTALSARITGTTLSLSGTLCNRGRAASGAFDIAFWLHRGQAPTCADVGSADFASPIAGGLPAGACTPFSVSGTVPADLPAFIFRSWLLVDARCAVTEPSETDNARAAVHAITTDIAARDFKATVTGRDVTLSGKVCLTGRPLGVAPRVALFVNPGARPSACAAGADLDEPIEPPAPGACTPFSLDARGVAAGSYTIWMRAGAGTCLMLDAPGTRADNLASVTFTVK